MKKCETALGSF